MDAPRVREYLELIAQENSRLARLVDQRQVEGEVAVADPVVRLVGHERLEVDGAIEDLDDPRSLGRGRIAWLSLLGLGRRVPLRGRVVPGGQVDEDGVGVPEDVAVVVDHRPGLGRLAKVAAHDLWTADTQFADFAGRQNVAVVVLDALERDLRQVADEYDTRLAANFTKGEAALLRMMLRRLAGME